MKILKIIALFVISISIVSCKKGPKVISAESTSENTVTSSGIFSETTTTLDETITNQSSFTDNLHKVVVKEVLPTQRYVYLNVLEDGKQFWVATGKQEISAGNTYFYRGGLLKTNFESKEYKRVFDTIYLVTSLVAQNHGNNNGNLTANFSEEKSSLPVVSEKKDIETHTETVLQHKGSIKISEIVANPSAFEGKTVQLTGKCVKVNPNIMNRNWIHLQDGSKDDFDLVVTSSTFVPEGKVVTIKAEVSLNRDFGAGYRYDLILENGIIID